MSGPGRPTLDKPEHASRARGLCARGATNPDLAGRFGVARSTIDLWLATHPEFAEAVQQGCDVAGATAVESLFTRVTGYNHQAEKVFFYCGELRTATYTAHVPSETRACMYWLRNRRPEDWRAKAETTGEVFIDDIALLDAASESVPCSRLSGSALFGRDSKNERRKGRKGRKPPILRK
jgi:hypothetical protein